MVYLDGEELLRLHKIVIDFAGGSHGVRDAHLLASILEKPQMEFGGEVFYPTVWDKAACYLESLANFHVFVDGNKRTAVAVTSRFLRLNGYRLTATNKEIESFIVEVVVKKFSVTVIAAWLKKHAKKLSR
ncbi:MAG: type II toxin-antitoxin system death-on-curing family toxin [Patescibacteria group bacterium]